MLRWGLGRLDKHGGEPLPVEEATRRESGPHQMGGLGVQLVETRQTIKTSHLFGADHHHHRIVDMPHMHVGPRQRGIEILQDPTTGPRSGMVFETSFTNRRQTFPLGNGRVKSP
jgi:hypothetical protein